MNPEQKSNVAQLHISPEDRRRSSSTVKWIFIGVAGVILAAVLAWKPWSSEGQRTITRPGRTDAMAAATPPSIAPSIAPTAAPVVPADDRGALTVSGYIINRERIEISPRFLGVVKWIGVKKGDAVTNGQVVVLLDDAEYRARLNEAEGRVAQSRVAVAKGELDYERTRQLALTRIESKQSEDDARLQLDSVRAALREAQGVAELALTYVDWCIIRSPINGVVVEKLVNPNELVMPQSFGGGRGPSTALIALADPQDLQVEIDMNESDLAKVFLGQKCRVSPEAYPEKTYAGTVAEIAPEANRAKGTLQIKVQIHDPDKFLTPELSAKVEFLTRTPK
jgi:RND family efflux transporter MFP subunit